MSEEAIEYEVEVDKGRVYTTYTGADFAVFVNGRVIGEALFLDWKEDMLSGSYDGYIDTVFFEGECSLKESLRYQEGDETILEVHLHNEFGQHTIIQFAEVEFVERKGIFSPDVETLTQRYKFLANDMIFNPQNLVSFDPTVEQEGEHAE